LQVEARSVFCYWAARELGLSATEMAKRLGMTQPGVGYAVSRGEDIVERMKYSLGD
ncbi:MAG: transposase, partial [Desulfobacterales bacterium]|nr:transposase [Desulfobacterales bacterium]